MVELIMAEGRRTITMCPDSQSQQISYEKMYLSSHYFYFLRAVRDESSTQTEKMKGKLKA